MSDLIDRQAAIDELKRISFSHWFECGEYLSEDTREIEIRSSSKALEVIEAVPSAQPEQRWTPVKARPMDDEERKEWSEKLGHYLADDEAVIYSNLPDDGQECIVCTKWGNVFIDTFQNDPDYGCVFEDHGDMDGITAWMPLPKPYAERLEE